MFKKNHPPVGSRPGTLVISSDTPTSRIKLVRYGEGIFEEHDIQSIEEVPSEIGEGEHIWLDVQGFGNEKLLWEVMDRFDVHPLAVEDLVNVPQSPKSEAYPDQQLIVVNVTNIAKGSRIKLTQIGLLLERNLVLTFHHDYNDLLRPVRDRLRLPTSRLRQNGADYLTYVILDTAVDTYYPVVEAVVRSVENLENRAINDPQPRLLNEINAMKNQLSNLRRSLWPQREALQSLIRGDSELISEPVRLFLRDTSDHCNQASDVIDMYREMASGLLNTYLSSVAHKSNEIMKFLTVISSIFVPMTFVAGVYGMNFPNIPEFSYSFAYPVFWLVIFCLSGSMLLFFLRNGWIKPSFLNSRRARRTPVGEGEQVAKASKLAVNELGENDQLFQARKTRRAA